MALWDKDQEKTSQVGILVWWEMGCVLYEQSWSGRAEQLEGFVVTNIATRDFAQGGDLSQCGEQRQRCSEEEV